MSLTRLLYFSENTMDLAGKPLLVALRNILATSIRNNKAAGITGALVFDNDWFVQALEGERAAVWRTLRRIELDERHANVVVIDARWVDERLFEGWWMGLAVHTAQTAAAFAPYLKNGMLRPQHMTAEEVPAHRPFQEAMVEVERRRVHAGTYGERGRESRSVGYLARREARAPAASAGTIMPAHAKAPRWSSPMTPSEAAASTM